MDLHVCVCVCGFCACACAEWLSDRACRAAVVEQSSHQHGGMQSISHTHSLSLTHHAHSHFSLSISLSLSLSLYLYISLHLSLLLTITLTLISHFSLSLYFHSLMLHFTLTFTAHTLNTFHSPLSCSYSLIQLSLYLSLSISHSFSFFLSCCHLLSCLLSFLTPCALFFYSESQHISLTSSFVLIIFSHEKKEATGRQLESLSAVVTRVVTRVVT